MPIRRGTALGTGVAPPNLMGNLCSFDQSKDHEALNLANWWCVVHLHRSSQVILPLNASGSNVKFAVCSKFPWTDICSRFLNFLLGFSRPKNIVDSEGHNSNYGYTHIPLNTHTNTQSTSAVAYNLSSNERDLWPLLTMILTNIFLGFLWTIQGYTWTQKILPCIPGSILP